MKTIGRQWTEDKENKIEQSIRDEIYQMSDVIKVSKTYMQL